MTHYHTGYGSIGCLPDQTDTYSTKQAAFDVAREWAHEHNENREGHHIYFVDLYRVGAAHCSAQHCLSIVSVERCEQDGCELWCDECSEPLSGEEVDHKCDG